MVMDSATDPNYLSCTAALPGTVTTVWNQTEATPCRLNTYQPDAGTSYCYQCPAGSSTKVVGATYCCKDSDPPFCTGIKKSIGSGFVVPDDPLAENAKYSKLKTDRTLKADTAAAKAKLQGLKEVRAWPMQLRRRPCVYYAVWGMHAARAACSTHPPPPPYRRLPRSGWMRSAKTSAPPWTKPTPTPS